MTINNLIVIQMPRRGALMVLILMLNSISTSGCVTPPTKPAHHRLAYEKSYKDAAQLMKALTIRWNQQDVSGISTLFDPARRGVVERNQRLVRYQLSQWRVVEAREVQGICHHRGPTYRVVQLLLEPRQPQSTTQRPAARHIEVLWIKKRQKKDGFVWWLYSL